MELKILGTFHLLKFMVHGSIRRDHSIDTAYLLTSQRCFHVDELIIDNCSALTDLSEIKQNDSIRKLTLQGLNNVKLPRRWDILNPNLTTLKIKLCTHFCGLTFPVEHHPDRPESTRVEEYKLKTMKITQCQDLEDLTFVSRFKHLQTFTLKRCYNVRAEGDISNVIQKFKRIDLNETLLHRHEGYLAKLKEAV